MVKQHAAVTGVSFLEPCPMLQVIYKFTATDDSYVTILTDLVFCLFTWSNSMANILKIVFISSRTTCGPSRVTIAQDITSVLYIKNEWLAVLKSPIILLLKYKNKDLLTVMTEYKVARQQTFLRSSSCVQNVKCVASFELLQHFDQWWFC